MVKKLLFLFFGILFFTNVNAETTFTLGGSTLNTTNYISVQSGWKVIEWRESTLYSASTFPKYFAISICTDAAPIITWLNNRYNNMGNELSLNQVHVYNTSGKCMFPDSSYTGAHLVYIIGEQNPDVGSSTNNWAIDSALTIYNNATASYSLVSIQYSREYIAYNAETNTIISQNAEIINSQNIINNSINNQTNAINNQTNAINNQTNTINNQTNAIVDDSLPNTSNFLDDWTSLLLENNTINQILYLPVNVLTNIKSAFNGNCNSYTIPFGITGGNETLTFTCWTIEDYLGSEITGLISGFIGFYLIYYFAIFLWKFYDDFTSMKDTLSIILENPDGPLQKGEIE